MNRLLPTPRRLLVADHPKARRRVLAHIDRRGDLGADPSVTRFRCRCGWNGWCRCSPAEARRGIPCPKCNPKVEEVTS